jgi:hypothetical protein
MQYSQVIFGAFIGFGFSLLGAIIMRKINQRDLWRRLRMEKLELLVRTIHKANQELRRFNKPPQHQDHQDIEDTINDISTIITLYFPEFAPLEARVGKAFARWMGTGEEASTSLLGELRGLEQDVVNHFQGLLSMPEILKNLSPVH